MEHEGVHVLYVAADGNDNWSGTLPEPNAGRADSPLATLRGARNRLRHLTQPPQYYKNPWQAQPVPRQAVVYLRDGRHVLDEPLTFGPADSLPVTYTSYPGERAVIDGGRRIHGWRVEPVNGADTWVVDLPEVARGDWYFRSLWVDGQRRARPRLPRTGWYWIEDVPGRSLDTPFHEGAERFIAQPGDIQPWRNLEDAEVVAVHYWVDEHLPIIAYDPATRLVQCGRRSVFALKDDVKPRWAKYYVENVFEALSEPGDWYLDRAAGRLYYRPLPGEDPATTPVFASRVRQFLRLVGDAEHGRLVDFVRFRDLTFQHADAELPPGGYEPSSDVNETEEPYWYPDINYAAGVQAAHNVTGAITFEAARACAVEDCTIEHIGGYAVAVGDGCSALAITGNELRDLGGGGVKINGAAACGQQHRRTRGIVITDNHIHHIGRVFKQAVGVLIMHASHNHIAHNHIHDLHYSGISVGWVWGFHESAAHHNIIEYNHIHQIGGGGLSDMGGIYTLGIQPGTVIRNNLIHDIEKANYGGWGIYMDEGSSHIVVEGNVVYRTSSEPVTMHFGAENIVRNNVFVHGRDGQVGLGRSASPVSLNFTRNIVVSAGAPIFAGGHSIDFRQRPLLSDLNLLWDTTGPVVAAGGQHVAQRAPLLEWGVEQWRQETGNDRHSLVADPGFIQDVATAAGFDGSLQPESPAWALGFQPIDISRVGPRSRDQETTLAGGHQEWRTKRA